MKILVTVRRNWSFVGLLEFDRPKPVVSTAIRLLALTSMVSGLLGIIWFIAFEWGTFTELTKALSSLDIYVYSLSVYVVVSLYRSSFVGMFDDLEKKIEERKSKLFNLEF